MTDEFVVPDWVEPRPYQREAIQAWLRAEGKGILQMATGTGKTVTALQAAAAVAKKLDGKLGLIIAVPYQHLVDQWADDVQDFGLDPTLAYQSRAQWQETLEREFVEFNMGVRDALGVITTHDTFASEPFQRALGRLGGVEKMLIADEVHHLGAPRNLASLPQAVSLRLGLSATPERWYDEEGTDDLFSYFGKGVVFEYPLQKAIKEGALCDYYYVPHIIELTSEEAEEYETLSATIAKLAAKTNGDLGDADLQGNTSLKHALFKRARLVGTAENKLVKLKKLLTAQDEIGYTLIYCGDGSIEDELTGETKRHVEAATELLRDDLNIRAHQFTAEESQATRERLLERFETGDLQALVAIRCLDEGVDVPATRTAHILASSSNPRQFVQRRGRILRQHPGKDHAIIHDYITVPPARLDPDLLDTDQFKTERNLIRKELERVNLFAEAALNHPDTDLSEIPTSTGSLRQLKEQYNLRQM